MQFSAKATVRKRPIANHYGDYLKLQITGSKRRSPTL